MIDFTEQEWQRRLKEEAEAGKPLYCTCTRKYITVIPTKDGGHIAHCYVCGAVKYQPEETS